MNVSSAAITLSAATLVMTRVRIPKPMGNSAAVDPDHLAAPVARPIDGLVELPTRAECLIDRKGLRTVRDLLLLGVAAPAKIYS